MTARLSKSANPGAEKAIFHSAERDDVMKVLIDALDSQVMFSLVMLALYVFVIGFIFL